MTRQACEWNDEQVETLTQLWMAGITCAKIAEQIDGATRNAVIGKVSRLGLPPRRSGGQPGQGGGNFNRKPRKPRKPKAKPKAKLARIFVPKPKPIPVHFTADTWEPLPGSNPATLEHLTGCKWPVSDPFAPVGSVDLFCNCAADGPYCAEHRARSVGKGTDGERSAIRVASTYVMKEAA